MKQNSKEQEIIEACDELKKMLLAQLKNFNLQDKIKIEEIKIRKEVLKARERLSSLRDY